MKIVEHTTHSLAEPIAKTDENELSKNALSPIGAQLHVITVWYRQFVN